MAKDTKKAEIAESEEVKSGEVALTADDADSAIQLMLSTAGKDLDAAINAVEKAKTEDFREEAQDFWKPEKPGDELRGVYMTKYSQNRYSVHVFAVKHPKTGKPMAMRVNGSRILSKELNKGETGKPVRIVYEGETKTEAGQKLNKFRVFWLGA